LQKVKENEALPWLSKPQSLRQSWTLHEAKGQQASSQASDESQEGLLRLPHVH